MTEKTAAPDLLEGFLPMDDEDWPEEIEDRWPAGRLRRTAMAAYDRLAGEGEINPSGVYAGRSGAVLVRYRARIPASWIHELLARAERKLIV